MQTTTRARIESALRGAGIHGDATRTSGFEDAVATMETDDRAIADRLIDLGMQLGARQGTVEAVLIESGFMAQDPAPVPAQSNGDGGDRLAAMEAKVAALVKLAERHLGPLPV